MPSHERIICQSQADEAGSIAAHLAGASVHCRELSMWLRTSYR
jgi:hypothetical protein